MDDSQTITEYDEPRLMTLGTYRELFYDAELTLDGQEWCRVQDGFGGGGDSRYRREDWVADIPAISVSVCWDDTRKGWVFGRHATRTEAMRAEVADHLEWIDDEIARREARVNEARIAKARLQAAAGEVAA